MRKVTINGLDGLFSEDVKAVPPKSYKHRAMLRHSETDWSEPVSIEHFVFCNRLGVVFTKKPLLSEKDEWVEVKQWEEK